MVQHTQTPVYNTSLPARTQSPAAFRGIVIIRQTVQADIQGHRPTTPPPNPHTISHINLIITGQFTITQYVTHLFLDKSCINPFQVTVESTSVGLVRQQCWVHSQKMSARCTFCRLSVVLSVVSFACRIRSERVFQVQKLNFIFNRLVQGKHRLTHMHKPKQKKTRGFKPDITFALLASD